MINRAIWLSVAFHLFVLLTISRFVLQSGSPSVRGTLVSHLPATERVVQIERAAPNELTRTRPAAGHQSTQAAPKRRVEPINQARQDSDFGRFFPSTARSPQTSAPSALTQNIEASVEAQAIPVETLGLFRLNLARSARAHKAYPAIARENGWEGVAIVSVVYPLGLGAPMTALERSSGHVILDRQALEMIERAVATTALPDAMQGKHFTVSLPIEYRLRE